MTVSSTAITWLAQAAPAVPGGGQDVGFGSWVMLLAAMALAPFVLTMVTSFAKLIIVGSILRHALGTPQIPPTTVITGLSLILTVHIMAPVVQQIYTEYQKVEQQAGPLKPGEQASGMETVRRIAQAAEKPMRDFLTKHAHPQNTALFEEMGVSLNHARDPTAPADAGPIPEINDPLVKRLLHDLTVTLPAFVLSQLTEAFQIGFLLFVPFLVIDLVVSNVLMAMGMQMMSPTTISMPLKLLLFVLVDGWRLILRGLVMSYS
ncbi:MAG: EscR/YscR/HrcR family type III secretion system export apparatus protein [Phycisphaerae bacterium]|nr:flagellar type III secretion system pore protein FliP [Tepidisphaeraceae bacterium]